MRWLKQSTSVDVPIGPFLDDTDGKTAETGLTLTQPDIRLKKNGGAWAQKNAAQTLSHEENGNYEVTLDATDTDTLGLLRLHVAESGALPVWEDFMVLPANVWDSLFGADRLQVHAAEISNDLITAAAIATGAIDADAIADNAIDAGAIASNAITAATIASDAITSAKLADGAITAAKLAADAITAAKIADGAIDAATFAADVDAEILSYVVDDATRIDASALNTASGTTIPAILTDTAEIGAAGAGLSAVPWNSAWDAEVQSEAADALTAYDPPTKAELDSGLDALPTAAETADAVWEEPIADHSGTAGSTAEALDGASAPTVQQIVDGVWDEPLGDHLDSGSTGAGLNAAGSAGDPWATSLPGAYGSGTAGKIVGDNLNATVSSRLAPTVAGRTLDVTAGGEAGVDWANVGSPTTTVNLSGTTVKTATDVETDTADIQSRIGTPSNLGGGASLAANLADIEGQTDDIGTAGAGLTAVPWNAAWDAEVQSEATDALNAYDPPTKAELDSGLDALPTAGETADAVWDEARADHTGAGSFGQGAASVQGNVTGSVASVSGNVGGNVAGSVGSVTGNVGGNVAGSVGSVATDGITSSSIAADAIGSSELAASAASEIATAVRTELATELARVDVAVSTRAAAAVLGALADAAADGDPTTTDTVVAYLKQVVNTLEGSAGIPAFPAAAVPGNAVSLAEAIRQIYTEVAGLDGASIPTPPTAGAIADAVWDEPKADHTTPDTFGDYLDDEITSRSSLDAAGVRSAVGLAAANLDTQLTAIDDAVDTEVAAVLAAVDTEVAAIKAKTDLIPAAPAAVGDIPTVAQILTTQMTEAYAADGVAPTLAQALFAIQQRLGEFSISGTTITVKKLDGSTAAYTLTLDSATTPTSSTRAT